MAEPAWGPPTPGAKRTTCLHQRLSAGCPSKRARIAESRSARSDPPDTTEVGAASAGVRTYGALNDRCPSESGGHSAGADREHPAHRGSRGQKRAYAFWPSSASAFSAITSLERSLASCLARSIWS